MSENRSFFESGLLILSRNSVRAIHSGPSSTNTRINPDTEELAYFPDKRILLNLKNEFDQYFRNCRDAIIFRDKEGYEKSYIAMNQTASLARYLESVYGVSGLDLRKMRIEMSYLQKQRDVWNEMLGDF